MFQNDQYFIIIYLENFYVLTSIILSSTASRNFHVGPLNY